MSLELKQPDWQITILINKKITNPSYSLQWEFIKHACGTETPCIAECTTVYLHRVYQMSSTEVSSIRPIKNWSCTIKNKDLTRLAIDWDKPCQIVTVFREQLDYHFDRGFDNGLFKHGGWWSKPFFSFPCPVSTWNELGHLPATFGFDSLVFWAWTLD